MYPGKVVSTSLILTYSKGKSVANKKPGRPYTMALRVGMQDSPQLMKTVQISITRRLGTVAQK